MQFLPVFLAIVVGSVVVGLTYVYFARARFRETGRAPSNLASGPAPAAVAEEVKAIGDQIERAMSEQRLQGETQRQLLAQKLDDVRQSVESQRNYVDGLRSELRHESSRRDAELDEIRAQIGSLRSAVALPAAERPALPAHESPAPLAAPLTAPSAPAEPAQAEPDASPSVEGVPAGAQTSPAPVEPPVEDDAPEPAAPVSAPETDDPAGESFADPFADVSFGAPEAPAPPTASSPFEDVSFGGDGSGSPSQAPSVFGSGSVFEAWSPSPPAQADAATAQPATATTFEETTFASSAPAQEAVPAPEPPTPAAPPAAAPAPPVSLSEPSAAGAQPTSSEDPLAVQTVSIAPPAVEVEVEPAPRPVPPAPAASAPVADAVAPEGASWIARPARPAPQDMDDELPVFAPADDFFALASPEPTPELSAPAATGLVDLDALSAAEPLAAPQPDRQPVAAPTEPTPPAEPTPSAEPPPFQAPEGADDLTVITSVTDDLQRLLYLEGVTSLEEIAQWGRTRARQIALAVQVSEETIMNQWVFEAQAAMFNQFSSQAGL